MKINSQHAIDELIANIHHKDLVKARLVLEHFNQFSEAHQRRALFELNRCDVAIAVPLMVFLLVRFAQIAREYPTLKELVEDKVKASHDLIYQYLQWEVPEQWYFIKLAGDLKIAGAVPFLTNLLTSSADDEVIKITLTALGDIGATSAISSIGELLYSADVDVAFTAVQTLNQLGYETAKPYLANALGRDESTDLVILDIFARQADEFTVEQLSLTMARASAPVRNYCKKLLVKLGEWAVPKLLENLASNDVDLQIHSLNVLQDIGSVESLQAVRQLVLSQPRNANVRFAAFEALAALPLRKGDFIWSSGLTDSDSNVRIAAARAVDHSFDERIASGVRHLVSRGDQESENLLVAILDSQSQRLFLDLVKHQIAIKSIVHYLATQAHADLRSFFLQVLLEGGYETLAEEIVAAESVAVAVKEKICAVDDSRMILNIYRSTINALGYEPVLFQNPEDALVWLAGEKPKLVCTDLNMPEMTGIELSRAIRGRYQSQQLPIIMVTTQDDKADNRAARAAGVDLIIHKPFDRQKLAQAFSQVSP
ncbi:MAG: response regulator [Gammaproteobacteria bacterium]|nr:response regulator [Gammaproteobacteria bacterium]